jgi:hypothetical protein
MIRTSIVCLSALSAVLGVCPLPAAYAAVVNGAVTGGDSGGLFELLVAPAAAGPNAFESPNLIAFDELQNVVLTEPLVIGPGLVFGPGSVLSSHYVVFDPSGPSLLEGTVLFDAPIVGVLIGSPQPNNPVQPLFGLSGTAYSYGPAMGLEPQDSAMVSAQNPNRLVVRLTADNPGDHLRVLTGTVVPEPTGAVLGAIAAAVSLRRGGRGASRRSSANPAE